MSSVSFEEQAVCMGMLICIVVFRIGRNYSYYADRGNSTIGFVSLFYILYVLIIRIAPRCDLKAQIRTALAYWPILFPATWFVGTVPVI